MVSTTHEKKKIVKNSKSVKTKFVLQIINCNSYFNNYISCHVLNSNKLVVIYFRY